MPQHVSRPETVYLSCLLTRCIGGLENASEYRITLPYKLIRADKNKRRSDTTPQYHKLNAGADEENNQFGMNLDDIDHRPIHNEHRIPRKPVPSRSQPAKTGSITYRVDERLSSQGQNFLGSSSSLFHDR